MNRRLSMMGGILGVIGGITMIIGAILEEAFPKPLWLVVALCYLINTIAIFMNYRYFHKRKDDEYKK